MTPELWRALGALAGPPGPALRPLAEALELGALPSRVEHTELFVLQLPPYASVYLGPEGMLGGEARDRVAGFWRAVGRTPPAEPDHLSLLLGLLGSLEEEAGDDPLAGHARDALLREHLLPWLPAWLAKASEQAPSFYRGWVGLLREALARAGTAGPGPLAAALEAASGEEGGGAADGTAAPETPDALVRLVTTPVRSGMILTRADLARASRSRGLPLRIGERRFALEAMLGAAPVETVEWLAEEADTWAERHRGWAALDPRSAGYWEARARATAETLRRAPRASGSAA